MSVPKQRHSNRRQARGRIRYNKKPKSLVACPQCSSPILSHRVCPVCGIYRGRKYAKSTPRLAGKGKSSEKKVSSVKKK